MLKFEFWISVIYTKDWNVAPREAQATKGAKVVVHLFATARAKSSTKF